MIWVLIASRTATSALTTLRDPTTKAVRTLWPIPSLAPSRLGEQGGDRSGILKMIAGIDVCEGEQSRS